MPVMKRLVVGGTTYDTVGEASVTQVQTSGTKIATVSIDGASTDIYAPASGLPAVTSSDNGKVLRVVNGAWAADALPSANGGNF